MSLRRMVRAAAVLVAAAVGALTLTASPARAASEPNLGPVLAFMHAQVGKPYVWGANGPDTWDCSSIVQAAYRQIGDNLPRVTYDQVGEGWRIDPSQIQPGDLVFRAGTNGPQPGHEAMYVGDGNVIEAKGTAWGVVVTPLAQWHPQAVIRPSFNGDTLNAVIANAAAKEGLPVALLRALLWQESRYSPNVASPAGAVGVAQFMPSTWTTRGVDGDGDGKKDPTDPKDAVPAAAGMLADLIRTNGGDVSMALAGYNAGQGAVNRYRGVPPFPETRNYVATIEANSGVSGHLDLHPQPAPAPPVAQQIVTAAVSVVAVPSLPTTATDWVHDITIATIFLVLLYLALRRLAPELVAAWKARAQTTARRAVRRAATPPPRPTGKPAAGWWARAFTASAVQAAERRAQRAARVRNGTAYRRTRVKVEPRRKPQAGRVRIVDPGAYRRPAATAGASRPIFAAAAVWAAAAVRSLALWLWSLRSGTANHTATAEPFAPFTATGPHAGRPVAVPPQGGTATTASPAVSPQPATATPHRSATMPISHPYDLVPQDHLTDPAFTAVQRIADAFESLDLSDGQVVASAYMVATNLFTALSGAASHMAAEAARRGLARPVHTTLGVAADQMQDAADSMLRAEKALYELHDTFFTTDISKPVQRIGA